MLVTGKFLQFVAEIDIPVWYFYQTEASVRYDVEIEMFVRFGILASVSVWCDLKPCKPVQHVTVNRAKCNEIYFVPKNGALERCLWSHFSKLSYLVCVVIDTYLSNMRITYPQNVFQYARYVPTKFLEYKHRPVKGFQSVHFTAFNFKCLTCLETLIVNFKSVFTNITRVNMSWYISAALGLFSTKRKTRL